MEKTDQEQARIKKLEKLISKNRNPYEFKRSNKTLCISDFINKYSNYSREDLEKEKFTEILAGRVMAIRQTFIVIKDFIEKTQLYINKKIHSELFEYFNDYLDVGDIIESKGVVMRSQKGELTLNVEDLFIISKALKPLPEKFHGLVDEETRARKRYLDLIMNPNVFEVFVLRSKIISEIRNFLNGIGYLEVETPFLQNTVSGASARPFVTHHNALNREYYLRIATEICLKKLIIGGFQKIYEIGRVFRNEGIDASHNPEFTSLELYLAYGDMFDMMKITEDIIKNVANKLNLNIIEFNKFKLDFSKPFKKVNMIDIIKEVTNVDFSIITTDDEALKIAKLHNIEVKKFEQTRGHIISLFFENFCEKKLIEPTFVTGYPIEVSPLAKRDGRNSKFTERFELFVLGKEIANAYSELNDPIDQKRRFEDQVRERSEGNVEASEYDTEFIEALEYGLPPTGGLGIGIDRLVMLFTKQTTIREVLLFPHMREEKK